MANVKINAGIVAKTYVLLCDCSVSPELEAVREEIMKYIEEKGAAIEKRQAYSAYRRAAPGTAEREAARQKYLDLAGISKGFRSQEETRG
ncbi:MAG: hypothetical protein FWG91_10245 [Lachnospiraceae bacterium]|nr:hypothetical protein [Lachnospiraceae bacterium]